MAIQFDVCQEVVGFDKGVNLPYDDILNGSVTRITDLCDKIIDAADVGIHLCYGDPGHKHILNQKVLEPV